jgi:hypothetical protein
LNADCLNEELTLNKVAAKLQNRWMKLEDKSSQIELMLLDLEETLEDHADVGNIKCTKAYIMLETKLNSIKSEQYFIEGLGALTHKE